MQTIFNDFESESFKRILQNENPTNILIICGKKSFINSGASEFIIPVLNELRINYIIFNEFSSNPKYDEVLTALNVLKTNKCDFIISVGGGTSIDIGKSIIYFTITNNELYDSEISLEKSKKINHLVVPTTAGSGSEATCFAVLYKDKIKYSLQNKNLIPRYIGFNYNFLMSQNHNQIAVSGLDALAQSIESYWSTNSTIESERYSLTAMKLLNENLLNAVVNKNVFSLKKIQEGAYLAGKAINISKTTGSHAISYYFTSNHNIDHGQAVFLTLPKFLKFNFLLSEKDNNDIRGVDYVKNKILKICLILSGEENIDKTIIHLKKLLKLMNVEISLSKLSIDFTDVKNKIEINKDRMKNNPRKFEICNLKDVFFD